MNIGHDHSAALGSQGHGLRHHRSRTHTHGHDDLIGHRSPGDFLQQGHCLGHRSGRMSRSKLHGFFAFELNRVNSDDALCPRQSGTLNGIRTNPADTYDSHGVPRANLRSVNRRAPAGDHTAAEQTNFVKRKIIINLDATGFVDHSVMGESTQQAHQTQFLTPSVMARTTIGDLATSAHQCS